MGEFHAMNIAVVYLLISWIIYLYSAKNKQTATKKAANAAFLVNSEVFFYYLKPNKEKHKELM